MKRILSALLAVFAVSLCAVPAFAADGRYLPVIPEFVNVGTSGGINVSVELDMVGGDAKEFFLDFYDHPYLIALDQWTPTEYYPQYNTQGDQEFIGNDRRWSVIFMKPHKSDKPVQNFAYEFTYYDPFVYPEGYDSRPIQINGTNGGYGSMDTLTYHYDFINKKFRSGVLKLQQPRQMCSYVIGSANLSHPVNTYPGYDMLDGNTFIVNHAVPDGITRHYDWWIGQKNIENVVKPIPPIDPPVEPPIDPPPDPPVDPPDVKPDKPLDPFDPSKPPSGGDGGYVPPAGDSDNPWFDYEPDQGIEIPPMPEFPITPPTLPPVDDPFKPPTDLPSVDDPFKPPTDLPSVDDPFKPPTDLPSVDDPFKPPIDLPSVDDPFKPPTDLPSVDDPFKPPTDLPSVDDPFKPPTDLPSVDDPFKPPTDLPSVDDPFKPPTDLPSGGGFPSWGWGEGDYDPFQPPAELPQFADPFQQRSMPRGVEFFGYNPFVIPDFLKKLFNLGN